MRITATFTLPRLDLNSYRKQLQEVLGDAIARAAFEWLGATTAAIPVWSGASLSTFQPLASQLSFALSVFPRAFVDRTNLGLQNSTGEVVADAAKGVFEFRYSTTLKHLIYNEFNNANISPDPTLFARLLNPGPYRFQEKGQAAVEKAVQGIGLPNPLNSITTTTLRVK